VRGFKKNKRFIFLVKCISFILIVSGFAFSSQATKVLNNVDYLYMHKGLEMVYPLPDKFKKEKLKFSGSYSRYVNSKYRSKSNDIHFTPKRTGSGVMIIKNKENKILRQVNIDIQKTNLHRIVAELRDLLIAVDGIEFKIYNKKVIIDGQVMLPREMDRIRQVISKYDKNLVENLVVYSPEAQKKIAETIEQEIEYPEVTVRYVHNRFLLEGCVNSRSERTRADNIARLYAQVEVSTLGKAAERTQDLGVVNNQLTFPCESEQKNEEERSKREQIKKLIQIVVHFVEMQKTFNKNFLFQWSPAIGDGGDGTHISGNFGGPQSPNGITAVLTATLSNFFPKLNWAKNFGFARVLHNSSLLIEEEQQGTISTNATVSHSTPKGLEQSTTAEVSTAVTPTIIGEASNFIRLQTQIVVSSPGSGKGTISRNISTTIHVRDGFSAAIGGLITTTLDRSYNPDSFRDGVSGRPVLNLYSSKKYHTSKTQFVVFITPIIKSQSHIGVERIKKKFKLDE